MSRIEEMQTFVRVVESGSITRAADQLDVAKSVVSRRLQHLEQRLGVSLLSRTTRRQVLTEAGRNYFQQCPGILDDIDELEASLQRQNVALSGRIKVAAPLTFGLAHLAPAISKFNEIHPDIHFDIDFSDRKVDLIEEGFDLAVRIAELGDSTLMARRLTRVRLMLLASPDYLASRGKPQSIAQLQQGHVRLRYRDSPDRWLFQGDTGETVAVRLPSVMSSNNGSFLLDGAIAGLGFVLIPDFVSYKAVKLGQLKAVLCDRILDNRIEAYAVYPQNRHLSARVRQLIDYLARYFGEEPYWSLSV